MVSTDRRRFVGVTEPGAQVLAAARFPAAVDLGGGWSVTVPLVEGWNEVVFTATDLAGNRSEARHRVLYEPVPIAAGRELPAAPLREVWAWCGVDQDDPVARVSAEALARFAGVDATFGPCLEPSPQYTPAHPTGRYASPEVYRRLVEINAGAGLRTIVYDARLWSSDATMRQAALAFWAPWFGHIAAWDLGDEFDPTSAEWSLLVERWRIVRSDASARSGIPPYANHLESAVDDALRDLPGAADLLSFTQYSADLGAATARRLDAQVASLMCGVNALAHLGRLPTTDTIRMIMVALAAAGCDRILLFGGHPVYGPAGFGDSSVVDRSGRPTSWATAVLEGAGRSGYVPVGPARLLDSRFGSGTIDGRFAGMGRREAGSTTSLLVSGRAGVPADVVAAVLVVTVDGGSRPGFITIHPCDVARPVVAQLHHSAGDPVTRTVIVRPASDGRVCLYTAAEADVAVDIDGFAPAGSSLVATGPARLLDTRVGDPYRTVDGQLAGIGRPEPGSVVAVPLSGRAGLPADVTAVLLTATVADPTDNGRLTVFPCGRPDHAAVVPFRGGVTLSRTVVTVAGDGGAVCLRASAVADLVVDLAAHFAAGAPVVAATPVRLLDTRVGTGTGTADGREAGGGPLSAGAVAEVLVPGRAGIPTTARVALLTITVTEPAAAGHVSLFPGGGRAAGTHVSCAANRTATNLAVAALGPGGTTCLSTSVATHLVVDVTGYLP
jgi:hypothetical protein